LSHSEDQVSIARGVLRVTQDDLAAEKKRSALRGHQVAAEELGKAAKVTQDMADRQRELSGASTSLSSAGNPRYVQGLFFFSLEYQTDVYVRIRKARGHETRNQDSDGDNLVELVFPEAKRTKFIQPTADVSVQTSLSRLVLHVLSVPVQWPRQPGILLIEPSKRQSHSSAYPISSFPSQSEDAPAILMLRAAYVSQYPQLNYVTYHETQVSRRLPASED